MTITPLCERELTYSTLFFARQNSLVSVIAYESIETPRKCFVMDLHSAEQQNATNRFVQNYYPAVPDLIEEYMWHYYYVLLKHYYALLTTPST
jgi:hypothetical protein